jgi:hypothetical protein
VGLDVVGASGSAKLKGRREATSVSVGKASVGASVGVVGTRPKGIGMTVSWWSSAKNSSFLQQIELSGFIIGWYDMLMKWLV